MRVHFIAIGGAVMHNLAIALHRKGYKVTGSDDEIFEPARSRLESYGLLPEKDGWDPGRITPEIDTIILGMHAKADNPELKKATESGLKIMSFPEYIYNQTKDKKRIVVAGSHGKTTTTAMIMHVFRYLGLKFDYMVGSLIDGYDTMVALSDESEFAVLEGDEYLTSPIDKRPKFHLYMPDIAILNGIAWDHMNVFPTFENYVDQFRIFIRKITKGGTLIYYENDPRVNKLAIEADNDIKKVPYTVHEYFQDKLGFYAASHDRVTPMKIFGEHNMQNLSAAKEACVAAGIREDDFYRAISGFEGTSKRLQKLHENGSGIAYLDFAHSPSKVKATVDAVASRYIGRDVVACLELHTYSSLNAEFLLQYRGTMKNASHAIVYYNPHAILLKNLPPLTPELVKDAFADERIIVFDDSSRLISFLKKHAFDQPVYLFMSSGDFNGCDLVKLSTELLSGREL